MSDSAKKAEDPKVLEGRFMDWCIPGNSERWWAVREITRLRERSSRADELLRECIALIPHGLGDENFRARIDAHRKGDS